MVKIIFFILLLIYFVDVQAYQCKNLFSDEKSKLPSSRIIFIEDQYKIDPTFKSIFKEILRKCNEIQSSYFDQTDVFLDLKFKALLNVRDYNSSEGLHGPYYSSLRDQQIQNAFYYFESKKIELYGRMMNETTFAHEYGHHIFYTNMHKIFPWFDLKNYNQKAKLARDMSTPYQELFADLVAVLAIGSDTAMFYSTEGRTPRSFKDLHKAGIKAYYLENYDLKEPHYVFAQTRLYIGEHLLNKYPSQIILEKIFKAISSEMQERFEHEHTPNSISNVSEINVRLINKIREQFNGQSVPQDFSPQESIIKDFFRVRNSSKPRDIEKFINYVNFIPHLEKLNIYTKDSYKKGLESIVLNTGYNLKLRKKALYKLYYLTGDANLLLNFIIKEPHSVQSQIVDDMISSKNLSHSKALEKLLYLSVDQNINTLYSLIVNKPKLNSELIVSAINRFSQFEKIDAVIDLLKHPNINWNQRQPDIEKVFYENMRKRNRGVYSLIPDLPIKNSAFLSSVLVEFARRGEIGLIRNLLKRPNINVNYVFSADFRDPKITALDAAARRGDLEVFQELLKHPKIVYTDSIFTSAILGGNLKIIDQLVKTPNIKVDTNMFTSHDVAMRLTADSLKLILDNNTDIDLNARTADGDPLLVRAVKEEKYDIAKILIKHPNVDVYATDWKKGKSALYYAKRNKHKETVDLLIERGAHKSKIRLWFESWF